MNLQNERESLFKRYTNERNVCLSVYKRDQESKLVLYKMCDSGHILFDAMKRVYKILLNLTTYVSV